MNLTSDTNHYLAIFVEFDRLVYHNPENLIQAGGIGKIERNVADLLDMKGYPMVDFEGKIKRCFRVAWINDSTLQTRDRDHSPTPPPKRQRLISSLANLSPEQPVGFSSQAPDNTLKESNQENDVLPDFLFDFTNNASDSSPSEPETSPLSSFRTTPEIPDPPKSSDPTAIYDKPVTRSHRTPNTELFGLLLSTNSPEVPEPKTYKQAVGKQSPRHDD